MSKVSGTDSLTFLQNLGLNTAAQGKSSSAESAGLFAAMLQGMPTDGAAAETPVAVASLLRTETVVPADLAQATATDITTSNTSSAPTVELIDSMMQGIELPEAAMATTAIEGEIDADLFTAPAGTQESVQFFEDQLALHNRFVASATAKTIPEKAVIGDPQTTTQAKARFTEVELDDNAQVEGTQPLPTDDHADTSASRSAAFAEPELRDDSPVKGKQLSADDNANPPAPEPAIAAPRTESAKHTELLTLADYAPERNANTDGEDRTMPPSPAAAIANTDTVRPYALAAESGNARNPLGTAAGAPLAPGFTPNTAGIGRGSPPAGKGLPHARQDGLKTSPGKDQSPIVLAGFTEVSGLEDTGLSFDDLAANSLLAPSHVENAQAQSTPTTTGTLTFDNALQESQLDSTAPEPLADATPLDSSSTMGSYEWIEDTATQLSWLHEQGLEKAHIKLHPEELGALDVSITVTDGQAYIQFVTTTPEARELLQNSLPNLRELLQHSGLALAEGNVAQGDARKDPGSEQQSQQQRFMDTPEAQPQPASWMRPAVQSRSQIDYYI